MGYRISCSSCGSELKLLLTSYYCPNCDIKGISLRPESVGYVIVEQQWMDLSKDKIVPPGTPMHLYKTFKEAERILKVVDFPALVAEADLSDEDAVVWSTPYSHYIHYNKKGIKLSPR